MNIRRTVLHRLLDDIINEADESGVFVLAFLDLAARILRCDIGFREGIGPDAEILGNAIDDRLGRSELPTGHAPGHGEYPIIHAPGGGPQGNEIDALGSVPVRADREALVFMDDPEGNLLERVPVEFKFFHHLEAAGLGDFFQGCGFGFPAKLGKKRQAARPRGFVEHFLLVLFEVLDEGKNRIGDGRGFNHE